MRTGYLIKPEAFSERGAIRAIIERHGLAVLAYTVCQLTSDDVDELYDEAPLLQSQLHEHLDERHVEVGVIEAEDAVGRFVHFAGKRADPRECDPLSLRALFGKGATVIHGRRFFQNALHRCTSDEEAQTFLRWYEPLHFRTVRRRVVQEARAACHEPERWRDHITVVPRLARLLADEVGGDAEIAELGGWLHDITRLSGDRENHHITGAEEARRILTEENWFQDKVEHVAQIVFDHRGSTALNHKSLESRVVASADAMGHLHYAHTALLYVNFGKHGRDVDETATQMRSKIRRTWRKMMPEARDKSRAHVAALHTLLSNYRMHEVQAVERFDSAETPGMSKFVLALSDKVLVEAVLLPKDGNTLCVSSQSGCTVRCEFCESGLGRNLLSEELWGQLEVVQALSPARRVSCLLFQGSGEPMQNYDNVVETIRTLHNATDWDLRFCISTIGIPEKLEELTREGLPVNLYVSLHGTTDEQRSIIPLVSPLADTIAAMRAYEQYGQRDLPVGVQYLMLDGYNDSDEDARRLVEMFGGGDFSVVLKEVCPISDQTLVQASAERYEVFARTLRGAGIPVHFGRSHARDAFGGCGHSIRQTRG